MDKKKLVLMYPNQRWYKDDPNTVWNLNPHTLCLLGAVVKDIVDVEIIDAQFYNLSVEAFIEKLRKAKPDFVGISLLTSEYAPILHTAAEASKKGVPGAIVIAGGVHVTISIEEVMKDKNIDYAVRGDGEFVLLGLLEHLIGNSPLPETGVVYRKKGELVLTPQSFLNDLSVLPWADFRLVNFEDYINHGSRYGPQRAPEFPFLRMAVTRGCPFGCSFCQVETIAGRKIRTRDAKDVVNEIEYLKKVYGIKSIIFDDDNIVVAKSFFIELLELMIERKLNIKFIFGGFAIFRLTEEILDLMVKAGCVGMNIAIESGNKRILKELIGKPVDLDKAKVMIEKIKQRGLIVLANFIIGFPGETWAEIRETLKYAETCGADYAKIFIAIPFKGTKLWDLWIKSLKKNPDSYDLKEIKADWRFGQVESDEWSSRDMSILRAYEWDRINFSSPEKIQRMCEIWGVDETELSAIRKRTRDDVVKNL